jgi:hypothetical protein
MPAKVRYHKQTYRLNKKTPRDIASRFGTLRVRAFYYLNGQDGEPGLHPLYVRLGIVGGSCTLALAERLGLWAVDFSQRQVLDELRREHGLAWSVTRLRRVLSELRRVLARFQREAQQARLLLWLTQAESSRGRHRPVLAVGRDGVMVPMRSGGYQEASTATVSVYDRRGQRLGTVYLGQMPEAHQKTMSHDLTELITSVLATWPGNLPRLVYVTDKGDAPEKYYRRVLRKMKDPQRPGQRLDWEWVLDYWHVLGYVDQLREALFGEHGQRWYQKMRHWLRDRRGGLGHVLRSATQLSKRWKRSTQARAAFKKAYRFLHANRCHMDYARYRRQGLPIGSGVTEAACKTVFNQRLKRSGMRWHRETGQVIVDLRVLHLSGLWQDVVQRHLTSSSQAEHLPQPSAPPSRPRNPKNAA